MEREIKIERVRKYIRENGLSGVLISKVSNFAWLTGGKRNFVALYGEKGVCSILITQNKIFLLTNNIEYPRIYEEEIDNIEFIVKKWYRENELYEEVKKICKGKIGSDIPTDFTIPVKLENLHFPFTDEEMERYRELGRNASESITEVSNDLKAGMREIEIAGIVSKKLWERNIIPVVILVAADERIEKYRHPIPTEKSVNERVMIVICAKKYGLIASLTRIINFGKIDDEIKRKHKSVCYVDSVFIEETKPGKKISDVFRKGVEAYKKEGFKSEWELHHQGGPTGYSTRYFRASENTDEKIIEKSAFAWNPSITGTKSEDTIIVGKENNIIITEDKKWPLIEIEYNGKIYKRPAILEK